MRAEQCLYVAGNTADDCGPVPQKCEFDEEQEDTCPPGRWASIILGYIDIDGNETNGGSGGSGEEETPEEPEVPEEPEPEPIVPPELCTFDQVKIVNYPEEAFGTPEKIYNVGFFMFKTRNPLELTTEEIQQMYYYTEVTPELIAQEYFIGPNGLNAYFKEASYGKIGFAGQIAGWIDVDREMTATEMFTERDDLFDMVVSSETITGINFAKIDIWILYGVAKSGSQQKGWGTSNMVITKDEEGHDQQFDMVGLNFLINSAMYRSTSWDGNPNYGSRVLPSTSWIHEMIHTLGINGHANSLWCDYPAGTHVTYSNPQMCETKGYGDPFDIMGSSGFATDLNCFNKWKLGWILDEEVGFMKHNDNEKHITVNKLRPLATAVEPVKCAIIEVPHFTLADNLSFEVNRVFFEFRSADGITDKYLQWLQDGGTELAKFTEMENVDIDGILVRVASWKNGDDATNLLDAHPSTSYTFTGIRVPQNTGRFVDSFLNFGEKMSLPAPFNIDLTVLSVLPGNSATVYVERTVPIFGQDLLDFNAKESAIQDAHDLTASILANAIANKKEQLLLHYQVHAIEMRAEECLYLPDKTHELCGVIPEKCEFDPEDTSCPPTYWALKILGEPIPEGGPPPIPRVYDPPLQLFRYDEVAHFEYPEALFGTPERIYNVGFFMFKTLNTQMLTATEEKEMYRHDEQFAEMIGQKFFMDPHGMNAYMAESSYGKVGFKGDVAGWIRVDKEMTEEEMFDQKDELFQLAVHNSHFSEIDFDAIEIWILYGAAASGMKQIGWGFQNRVTIADEDGNEKIFYDVGHNFLINSNIYRETSWDGNAYYGSRVLPGTSWIHEMIHTLGVMGHENSLQCDDAASTHVTYSSSELCQSKGYGDPFGIMGSSGFATDINCFSKWKIGWIPDEEVAFYRIDETATKTITVNPLRPPAGTVSSTKCAVIEVPHFKLADNLTFDVNRVTFEYRLPEGITDRYLQWLRDGGEMLSRFSDLPNVDIEGILVRAATWDPTTETISLFDAHPETPYKEMGIRWENNAGRFVDAFLNLDEEMELGPPMNLRLKVVNILPNEEGVEVEVTRAAALSPEDIELFRTKEQEITDAIAEQAEIDRNVLIARKDAALSLLQVAAITLRAEECLYLAGETSDSCGPVPEKCEFDPEQIGVCPPTYWALHSMGHEHHEIEEMGVSRTGENTVAPIGNLPFSTSTREAPSYVDLDTTTIINVGFFMFMTKNAKRLTQQEVVHQYSYEEINPDMIAREYFENANGLNHWFQESSYGQVAFKGTVVGWINVDQEYTDEQMVADKENLFTQAAVESGVDMSQFDVFVLYGWAKTGSTQMGWAMQNRLTIIVEGAEVTYENVGFNYLINSPMYKGTTMEGNSYYGSRVLPSTSWVHEMVHTLGIGGHANTLWCDHSSTDERYTFLKQDKVVCETKGYGDPFDIMGSSGFATDLNCHTKIKLGWLKEEDYTVIKYEENDVTIVVNPLQDKSSSVRCVVVEVPAFSIASNLNDPVDRIYFEYRTPSGITDHYLSWLRDGSDMLQRFSDLETVDINGILVRAASSQDQQDHTQLFDAHPETEFKEMSIRWPHNIGRFVDAFLNVGEEMILPEPINLKLNVNKKIQLQHTTGMEVRVQRLDSNLNTVPNSEVIRPPFLKSVDVPAGYTPEKTIHVGFFMFTSKNPKEMTELEKLHMYEHRTIDPDLIAQQYFLSQYGVNTWFQDASYGHLAFKGTIVGWVRINKEYTAEEMFEDTDYLLSQAAKVEGVTEDVLEDIDVFVIYGRAATGEKHHSLTMNYRVNIKDSAGNEKEYNNVGLNYFINSPIFRISSQDGEIFYQNRVLPNTAWIQQMVHTLGLRGKANSLWCDNTLAGSRFTFSSKSSVECVAKEEGDLFDMMGTAAFATDLNCFTKIKLGWLKEEDYITIGIDEIERIVEINPLGDSASQTKCVVVESNHFTIGEKIVKENRLFFEYRTPNGFSDQYLTWLQEGSETLQRYSHLPTVNTDGILVRVGCSMRLMDNTYLLDAHPQTELKADSTGIKHPQNVGRFVDAFLNVGEIMDLKDPIDIKLQVLQKTSGGLQVKVIRTKLKEDENRRRAIAAAKLRQRHAEEEARAVARAIQFAEETGMELLTDSQGNVVVEQTPEQVAEIQNEIANSLGEEVAAATVAATAEANSFREKHGIPPVKVDVAATVEAQAYLENMIFGLSSQARRRRLQEEENEDCGRNVFQSTDPTVAQVTTAMAVQAWYDQKIYFDYSTGMPKPGHEEDAQEFIQVIYKDTKKVGFGVLHPYVVGWYCPKANMDPEALMVQVVKPPPIDEEALAKRRANEAALAEFLRQKAIEDARIAAEAAAAAEEEARVAREAQEAAFQQAKEAAEAEAAAQALAEEQEAARLLQENQAQAAADAEAEAERLAREANDAMLKAQREGSSEAMLEAQRLSTLAAEQKLKAQESAAQLAEIEALLAEAQRKADEAKRIADEQAQAAIQAKLDADRIENEVNEKIKEAERALLASENLEEKAEDLALFNQVDYELLKHCEELTSAEIRDCKMQVVYNELGFTAGMSCEKDSIGKRPRCMEGLCCGKAQEFVSVTPTTGVVAKTETEEVVDETEPEVEVPESQAEPQAEPQAGPQAEPQSTPGMTAPMQLPSVDVCSYSEDTTYRHKPAPLKPYETWSFFCYEGATRFYAASIAVIVSTVAMLT